MARARRLLLIVSLLGVFIAYWSLRERAPVRNDYTTTPASPPVFKKIAELPANQGRDMAFHYPADEVAALDPFVFPPSFSQKKAFELLLSATQDMPRWEVIESDAQSGRVEAVATTGLLRFKDDVVMELRPSSDSGSLALHMRSKSRVGRSDFGANVKRMEEFFEVLKRLSR